MPDLDPLTLVRVRDLDTGYERTVTASETRHGNYEILDSHAVDPRTGDVIAPISNPSSAPAAPASHADGGDAPSAAYDEMTKDALEAEVEKRTSERGAEHPLVVGGRGNKPDLIAALEADDADKANHVHVDPVD